MKFKDVICFVFVTVIVAPSLFAQSPMDSVRVDSIVVTSPCRLVCVFNQWSSTCHHSFGLYRPDSIMIFFDDTYLTPFADTFFVGNFGPGDHPIFFMNRVPGYGPCSSSRYDGYDVPYLSDWSRSLASFLGRLGQQKFQGPYSRSLLHAAFRIMLYLSLYNRTFTRHIYIVRRPANSNAFARLRFHRR